MSGEEPQTAKDSLGPGGTPTETADSPLTDNLALALLENRDLRQQEIERIVASAVIKCPKVRVALAAHPRTPRRIALRLIRELYTFDLMQFSLMPEVAADRKHLAAELLVARLASIPLGERISLARRSSAMVAGALLSDEESPVWQTALENPRLTEAAVIKALRRPQATPAFVEAVCHHPKWSLRLEVRIALLRNGHTPLARALEFARRLTPSQLRDDLHGAKLPEQTKTYLRRGSEVREK